VPAPPTTASLIELIDQLREDAGLAAEVVHTAFLPAQESAFAEPDPPLPAPLAEALAAGGAERLWSHQEEGLAASRRGEDVLITTPTASGKSLVFQLPVLEEALAGRPGKALFLFPLKALGQDQRAKLERMALACGLSGSRDAVEGERFCAIYDGDTARADRERIRRAPPRVLISNPDMVHFGMLGSLGPWAPFLADLRWVVLDELHTYRGIFGSHFHHVLRRFLRACDREGSRPQLIASSATAANAEQFAGALTGRQFHWVDRSGAPREGRHLVLLQPIASPYTATLRLFERLLRAGLKTIVFAKARRITELLYSWLRSQQPELARRVACYRSGFLPEERREIERRMFEGELDGVISTSALEMGIDVGGLDACVLVGFPGSMMATWQRSGRVGRAGRESLTALVAMPDALDQFFLSHPEQFLERPCERLVVDPDNEPVSRAHLVCAAAEIPLSRRRDGAYLERYAPLVGELLRDRALLEAADSGDLLAAQRRPQRNVQLRGTGETYSIHHAASGRTVGTVDGVRVLHECHPGAVYLHSGRQYLVRDLDLAARKVHAEPVRLDYFTTPMTEKETRILEVLDERTAGPLVYRLGRLEVTERVVGFERKRIGSLDVLGRHAVELPPSTFETVGLWFAAPRETEEQIRLAEEHFMGSLHAAEHAAISLFPLLALCDRNDIGGISFPLHPEVESGVVFIYDGHPGGIGIAAGVFPELPELLDRVQELLARCPCDDGCPSCVQSPKCGNGNRPLDKAGAARLLRLLRGREEPSEEAREAASRPRVGVEASAVRRSRLARPGEELEPSPWAKPKAPEAAGPAPEAAPQAPRPAAPPAEPAADRTAPKQTTAQPPAPAVLRAPAEPPLPARSQHTVLFDLETLRSAADVGGWGNAHRMGVAIGVACHLQEGRFEVYGEGQVGELVQLLKAADLVIGFNIKRFDYAVLSGYTGEDYCRTLPTLDLLEVIHRQLGRRISLSNLAQATLGADKSADGLQSLEWVKEARLDLVTDYCRQDVELLRDLYLFGRREGYVVFTDKQKRAVRLPIEW
jgi:DEAD/DEAH box helicase domain-containing protein